MIARSRVCSHAKLYRPQQTKKSSTQIATSSASISNRPILPLSSKLNYGMSNLKPTGPSNGSQSPKPDKKNVIVFDIDYTLCNYSEYSVIDSQFDSELSKPSKWHPETERVRIGTRDEGTMYNFFPYIHILMDYLLAQNARVTFFSAGSEYRNELLIEEILHRIMDESYSELVCDGQFKIFSQSHGKKDLTKVLNDLETLNDAILVDDKDSLCAEGQEAFIKSPTTFMNLGYYFLGIFMTYFESDQYQTTSLREFLSHQHSTNSANSNSSNTNTKDKNSTNAPTIQFQVEMILKGLQQVRRCNEEALFYKPEVYLLQDPSLNRALFHHTATEVVFLLDSLLSGERLLAEPSMFVFMQYLEREGLAFYSNTNTTCEVKEKYLQVLNMDRYRNDYCDEGSEEVQSVESVLEDLQL